MHEHGLAFGAVPAVNQRVIRRGVRHIHRGALREAHGPSERVDLQLGAERHLRVRAAQGAADVDAIARLHAAHAGADRFDDARRIGARSVWELRPAVVGIRAQVGVDGIDADRVVAHQHLSLPGLRCGHLFELQDRRTTVLRDADRFH